MNSRIFAIVVESMLVMGVGIYLTLLGYRMVGKRPGEDLLYDQKMEKACPKLKIFGPIIVGGGILIGISQLLQNP